MTERILIVDDERNLRESLSEALSQAGYQVLTASNGNEAYSMIQEQDLDLLLCDWRMPEMDGAALLNVLREEGRLVDLPALVITAHGTSNNAIDAIQLGAYDFVTKPFDLDDVIVTIRRALEHSSLQKEVKQLRHAQRVQRNRKSRPNELHRIDYRRIRYWQGIGGKGNPRA